MSVSGLRPIISGLSRRMYAAQAASLTRQAEEVKSSLPKQDVEITTLSNGLQVASLENYSPISKVAVVARAGSRYETTSNLGVSHCLRNCANMTTTGASALSIARGLDEIGASLEASSTREHMFYSIQCMRDHLDTAFFYLSNISTGQEFRPWEISGNTARMQFDLACLQNNPEKEVVENLHNAAFRDTLGRSLYSPDFMLGKHSPDMVAEFVKTHFVSGNMAVVGVGVDHNDLVKFAENMNITSGNGPSKAPAKFNGGAERRNPTGHGLSYAALAVDGLSLSSKELLIAGVLQQFLGAGPFIKWSSNQATSKLNKVASNAATLPFATSCINLNYSDGGLFGIYAIAQPSEITPILKATMAEVRHITKGNISDADLLRAKNQYKAAILMNCESNNTLVDDLAVQVLETGTYKSVADIIKDVDDITAQQASNVAKKVFSGRPSMAASGNLSQTGYLDEVLSG